MKGHKIHNKPLKPYLQNTIPTRRGKKEKDFPLWLVFLSLFCIIRRGQETRDLETFYLQPNYRSVLLTKLVENWLNVIQRISMRKKLVKGKNYFSFNTVVKCRVRLLSKSGSIHCKVKVINQIVQFWASLGLDWSPCRFKVKKMPKKFKA